MLLHHKNADPAVLCVAVPSPVGTIRVSEYDGAIVAVAWGDADPAPATPLLAEVQRQLAYYYADGTYQFDLPLKPAGTEFQRAVWRVMRAIPAGSVRTYGEVARELISAARAVGGACGANPIPIIIPCHRIVAASGLGGFSGEGGVEAKRQLLAHENATPPALALANGTARV